MLPSRNQNGAVTSVYYEVLGSWEQWFLFTSDNHFDSIYCNREQMRADFDEAKAKNARICILGDWYDAMQGRYDPRRTAPELRPEYSQREDYYDVIVRDSADWLEPYADHLEILSDGNHELGVLKNANTNIMDRLVYELRQRSGKQISHGGYGGWLRIMLWKAGRPERSVRVKYFHGAGGEAPVTRGAIQTNRQAVYLPDANIVVNGHSHHSYYIPITRERLGNKGNPYMDIQHHIRIPGYKQSYGDGTTGWDVTRGGTPKPIGSCWVRMYYLNERLRIQVIPLITSPEMVSVEADVLYSGPVFDDDGIEE